MARSKEVDRRSKIEKIIRAVEEMIPPAKIYLPARAHSVEGAVLCLSSRMKVSLASAAGAGRQL